MSRPSIKTRPDAGNAFFGQTIDLTQLTEAEIAHAGIGRKFQKPTVFEQHTVFENLELAMKADQRVRATVKNQDHALLPGQYARVRLRVRELDDALMVPQVAVGSSQIGKYLYVVTDGKAEMRTVTLGPVHGTDVAVLQGIKTADQVIVGNLQKIGPGAPVQPLPPQQRQAEAAR